MSSELTDSVENDRFAKLVGIKLTEVRPGYAEAQLTLTDKHKNGVDIVQGGVTFTLADYAFAAASNAKGRTTVSIHSDITYLKPPKGGSLKAEAEEISSSRKLCNYNVDVFDENGDLIAKVTTVGYIKE